MTSDQLQKHYLSFIADPVGYEATWFNALRYHIIARLGSLPPAQREAAAQDISIIIWASHDNFDPEPGPISFLINTIIRNWKSNYFNSRKGRDERRTVLFSELEGESEDDEGSNETVPFEPIAASPPLPMADYSVLAIIPDWVVGKDRILCELLMYGFTLQESASRMGIGYQALRQRFHRIMKKCSQSVSQSASESCVRK
jgi:DNA-directed RNA polymerase specialized sigma24 family protein